MSKISWGKPRIFVKDVDASPAANAYELATPIENSTQLTATKGEKLEAKIEGGENEDVKYKHSTYTLVFNIRKAKGRRSPFPTKDGVVNNHYAIMLQPEDPSCEGFYIASGTVSVDDVFTTAEGAVWQVTYDAVASKTSDTVKWGLVQFTNAEETALKFQERSSLEYGGTAVVENWTVNFNANTNGHAGSDSSEDDD